MMLACACVCHHVEQGSGCDLWLCLFVFGGLAVAIAIQWASFWLVRRPFRRHRSMP